ncbi:KIR-like protein [Plasmodium coatneyi]|uniref:KIR-like protein n=1 Tax=Plasmodium coatneyi TaxID=208452 RepID=A0A1B1E6T5_9APIC|nr:KIR-like protein [Plasmodium coatneyi]ANQ10708.1 KIR-like protein [Plasmodium coatneyi]
MVEDQFLNTLNSYALFYNTFNNDDRTMNDCSTNGVQPEQLKTKLRTRDKYWNDLGGKSFSGLLKEIHNALKDITDTKKCRTEYSDVNETLLPQMKKVFDYFQEHATINDRLLKNGPKCDTQWSTYVNKISSACEAIREDCAVEGKGQGSNDYCGEFNKNYRVHCGVAEALNLYCKEAATLGQGTLFTSVKQKLEAERLQAKQEKESISTKLDDAISKASAASSLSSAFGTLAALELPALAYFLYKVKYIHSTLIINHGLLGLVTTLLEIEEEGATEAREDQLDNNNSIHSQKIAQLSNSTYKTIYHQKWKNRTRHRNK